MGAAGVAGVPQPSGVAPGVSPWHSPVSPWHSPLCPRAGLGTHLYLSLTCTGCSGCDSPWGVPRCCQWHITAVPVALSPALPVALSPALLVALSPALPMALSPALPVALSPALPVALSPALPAPCHIPALPRAQRGTSQPCQRRCRQPCPVPCQPLGALSPPRAEQGGDKAGTPPSPPRAPPNPPSPARPPGPLQLPTWRLRRRRVRAGEGAKGIPRLPHIWGGSGGVRAASSAPRSRGDLSRTRRVPATVAVPVWGHGCSRGAAGPPPCCCLSWGHRQ